MSDDFYRAFEERYRGPRELIKARQRVYLPFIKPLLQLHENAPAIDLGCGRGEWLEILAEAGFKAHGVDLDEGMLAACREAGLHVTAQDALSALKALPDASQAIVTGFHIAEHIAFADLRLLIQQALRVLKPAGLLILETPNPENITVGTVNFYLDPTHQKPLPPQLLAFLPEHYGFARVKTLRLQEDASLAGKPWITLRDVLEGVSPDYAVVAQKGADAAMLEGTSSAFAKEYGLRLNMLLEKWDQQAQQASQQAQQASQQAAAAQAQAQQAGERAANAEAALRAIHQSRSWRITAPLRKAGHLARALTQKAKTLRSPAKRQIGAWLTAAAHQVNRHPRLRHTVMAVLAPFPAFKGRLKAVASHGTSAPAGNTPVPAHAANLTPHALRIYNALKNKMDNREKERN